jgi:hypothetical protein
MRLTVCAPVVLLALLASAAAGQKPRVRVAFDVKAALYTDRYDAAKLKLISDSAAAILARGLDQRLAFLSFAASPDSSVAALTARLRENVREGDRFDDVRLFLELALPGHATRRLPWLIVRPRSSADPVPRDALVFLAAFTQLLQDSLKDATVRVLVDSLLNQIPIADSVAAAVWRPIADRPPDVWLLPYTRQQLCIGFESSLKISYVRRTSAGEQTLKFTAAPSIEFRPPSAVPAELQRFVGSLGATPLPQDTAALRLIQADAVRVKAVYVATYLFDEDSCQQLQGVIP